MRSKTREIWVIFHVFPLSVDSRIRGLFYEIKLVDFKIRGHFSLQNLVDFKIRGGFPRSVIFSGRYQFGGREFSLVNCSGMLHDSSSMN